MRPAYPGTGRYRYRRAGGPCPRRRPGRQATSPERSEGLGSAARRARQAGKELFEYRACATCHQVDEKAQSVFGWDIVPVRIARTGYPKAAFDHGRHATVPCADCHGFRSADCTEGVTEPGKGAADCIKGVADSEKSEHVLITGIATCRECHADPGAANRVQSTCISCHGFHISPGFAMDGRPRPKPGGLAPLGRRRRCRRPISRMPRPARRRTPGKGAPPPSRAASGSR